MENSEESVQERYEGRTPSLGTLKHYLTFSLRKEFDVNPNDERVKKLEPNYKLWLERDGKYIFGPGAFAIIKSIHEEGTITKGAKKLGMSYRYAWGVIKKIEKELGVTLVDTFKGGTEGGGGARVTDYGLELMELYSSVNDAFNNVLEASDQLNL
ncbi:MAG: winged helix-turn-helix domain-containing protein [Candidatus Thorarchaeota archaeon]